MVERGFAVVAEGERVQRHAGLADFQVEDMFSKPRVADQVIHPLAGDRQIGRSVGAQFDVRAPRIRRQRLAILGDEYWNDLRII